MRSLLKKMVEKKTYRKKALLHWTDELKTAFQNAKETIHSCPKLFFLDGRDSPITLYTDASDYGFGVSLTQTVDGEEIPIAFLSKSLTRAQLNWDTPKRGGYAIF
jgi:hypothetical protein